MIVMDEHASVLQEHLDALCPELAAVVTDAVDEGNEVAETWTGFGNAVRLKNPRPVLTAIEDRVRARLTYHPVRDPHYWLGEIHCRRHPGWFVALPYPAHGPADEPTDLPQS